MGKKDKYTEENSDLEDLMNEGQDSEADKGANQGLVDADLSSLDIKLGNKSGSEDNLIKGLKAEIEKLRLENDEHRDKYLRSLAEFENYKKRALKERSDLLKYQGERVFY